MMGVAVIPQKGARFNPPASEQVAPQAFASTSVPLLQLPTSQPSITLTHRRKVLFVTSELADLVKTGGLGDVSAALPRAMRHLHDVRVLIPGYPQVLNSGNPIHVISELGGHAALPPCKIGRMDMKDGLVIYVLICPELYEREGTPYGD
ncbi:glycogen/starch synthase, partial [Pseudomonas sp. 5B4]